jgi:hypothetical protein
MTAPTKRVITDHLTRSGATKKQATTWAPFLHGLDWPILKPLVQMAINAHVHPALAAGMVARSTGDEHVRAILTTQLESKAGLSSKGTPGGDTTTPTLQG